MTTHHSNDSPGYRPTREAYGRGGFEVDNPVCCVLEKGALEKIVTVSKDMMNDLFGERAEPHAAADANRPRRRA